jgi:hypothetical protein
MFLNYNVSGKILPCKDVDTGKKRKVPEKHRAGARLCLPDRRRDYRADLVFGFSSIDSRLTSLLKLLF